MHRQLFPIVALVVLLAASASSALAQGSDKAPAKTVAVSIVNLNTASASEFEALPGVGAKMAARIIEYRQKNGPFKKIEDLMNVPGIGEKNFLKLKPQLTVASNRADAS